MRLKAVWYLCVSWLLLCTLALAAQAPGLSPVGRWRTVEGAIGEVKSLKVIWQENRMLYVKLEEEENMRLRLVSYLCASWLLLCTFVVAAEAAAQISSGSSPAGRWKTVNDATGKLDSVVVIWQENGKLYGKIEKLIDPDPHDPDPRCSRCEGELKNKALVGLRILWDFKKDGDRWSGGKVLDPDNGKIYNCYLQVEDGGKKLKVRGFIGFSVLGRTQYWLRDE